MDSGRGYMETIDQEKWDKLIEQGKNPFKEKEPHVFIKGEIVEVKGSKFEIDNISRSHISLRILPDNEIEKIMKDKIKEMENSLIKEE